MADLITVARPYAEALYGLAKESGQEQAWADALQALAAMIADVQAQAFLTDPERADAEKVSLLTAVPVTVDAKAWEAFLALLVHNDRWPATAEIGTLFADAMRRARPRRHCPVPDSWPARSGRRGVPASRRTLRLPDRECGECRHSN